MAKQSRLPPFLLTRPAQQAERFDLMLRKRFGAEIRIIHSPLIAPEFLTPEIPRRPYQALIFSSETGVYGFRQLSTDPMLSAISDAWCVGDRTAQAAKDAGLFPRSARGDLAALEAAILAERPKGPLLYLHGRERQADLAYDLNLAGIETVSAVVYSQNRCPLNSAAAELLASETAVILPLFSPRSASLLLSELNTLAPKAQLFVVAMSDAVAQVLQSLPYAKMIVASRPDALAMLDAIKEAVAAVPHA